MTPLPALATARATVAALCTRAADKLTGGNLSHRLELGARDGVDLLAVRRTVARLTGELAQARETAETALGERDAARDDLHYIADLLARRHVIASAPRRAQQVYAEVQKALGDDAAPGSPLSTVAAAIRAAVQKWTDSGGKPKLWDHECQEVSWVTAAAVSGWLRDDLATGDVPTPSLPVVGGAEASALPHGSVFRQVAARGLVMAIVGSDVRMVGVTGAAHPDPRGSFEVLHREPAAEGAPAVEPPSTCGYGCTAEIGNAQCPEHSPITAIEATDAADQSGTTS